MKTVGKKDSDMKVVQTVGGRVATARGLLTWLLWSRSIQKRSQLSIWCHDCCDG